MKVFDPNKHVIHVNCERPISPKMERVLITMCELAYNMPSKKYQENILKEINKYPEETPARLRAKDGLK